MPQPTKSKPRKNRRRKEYLRPDGINLIIGRLSPITIMIRHLHSNNRYVRPAGANKIFVIGFINENECDTRGYGFKKLYTVSNPYNEPYCQQKKGRFELQTTINQSNILRLLTSGLITTNTAAFCALPKADSVAYGFLMVDTDENNRLILGTLSKYVLGCETWINKINWQLRESKRREISNLHSMKSSTLPGGFWTDFTSLAKNTSLRMQLIVQNSMTVKQFEKLIDELLHHARIIGNNPKWLCGIMSHLRTYAKSREVHQALKIGIKKVEQFEL